jgi:flagellar motor protein MotB
MSLLLVWACAHHKTQDAALVEQLDREVLALKERNEALWTELRKCDTPDVPLPIYQELTQAFAGTEVVVSLVGLDVALDVPGPLLYDLPQEVQLSERAALVTDLLATALRTNPDPHLWIISHLDGTPLSPALLKRFGSDWELGGFQAVQVGNALLAAGVDGDRITVATEGSTVEPGQTARHHFTVVVGPEVVRR